MLRKLSRSHGACPVECHNAGLADQKEIKSAEFGYESPDYQEGFQDGYHCGFDMANSSTVINIEDGEEEKEIEEIICEMHEANKLFFKRLV